MSVCARACALGGFLTCCALWRSQEHVRLVGPCPQAQRRPPEGDTRGARRSRGSPWGQTCLSHSRALRPRPGVACSGQRTPQSERVDSGAPSRHPDVTPLVHGPSDLWPLLCSSCSRTNTACPDGGDRGRCTLVPGHVPGPWRERRGGALVGSTQGRTVELGQRLSLPPGARRPAQLLFSRCQNVPAHEEAAPSCHADISGGCYLRTVTSAATLRAGCALPGALGVRGANPLFLSVPRTPRGTPSRPARRPGEKRSS